MSSVNPIVYPLDLTGASANNLVSGEPHTVGVSGNRVFVPNYGPFYARKLVVRDRATQQVLSPGSQYKAIQMLPDITAKTGLLVCSMVYIVDPTVSPEVEIDYQVVGGDFSTSVSAIQELINGLDLDNRPVYWGQIVGKPAYYPPASHFHDLGDVYGFEYMVAALYAVRDAILVGDDAAHQEIFRYVDNAVQPFNNAVTLIRNELNSHLSDTTNPHQVTKIQVGLGNVQNYAVASVAEAQAGVATDKYMTPALVKAAIAAMPNADLTAHIAARNNPHQVTKDQVGLGNVQNYNVASVAEAQAGVATDKYMTPALVNAMITAYMNTNGSSAALTAHINNLNNPHQVTKDQVGLGSVQNYPVASVSEASDGTATNRYMTPSTVRTAIQSIAVDPLTSAINQRIVTGSNGQLSTLAISSSGYLYQDSDGSISLRVAGSKYFQWQAGGNFVIYNGRTISSGGFQPSDRRLKKDIHKENARPLWRSLDYKNWIMCDSGEAQKGFVAQDLLKAAPDRVIEYKHAVGEKKVTRYAVDNVGTALEMAYAAGIENDRLARTVAEQETVIKELVKSVRALEKKLSKAK